MQTSLYQVIKPQKYDLDFGSEVKHFYLFDYNSKNNLKELPQNILGIYEPVYVAEDLLGLQHWLNFQETDFQVKWLGPQGLDSSFCKALRVTSLPMFVSFINDLILYSSKDPPSAELLEDLKKGSIKPQIEDLAKEVIEQMLSEVVSGTLKDKDWKGLIPTLQQEILNYQKLVSQQQSMIDDLKQTIEEKNQKIQQLSGIM